jgi:hypothetical protein
MILVAAGAVGCADFLFRPQTVASYEMSGEYTLVNSNRTKPFAGPWKISVRAVRRDSEMQAAVVGGWVNQLPWFEPGRSPRDVVAIRDRDRVWLLKPIGTTPTEFLAKGATAWRASIAEQKPDIACPLSIGSHWGEDDDRADGRYRWNVVASSRRTLPGFGRAKVFELRYDSNPDTQVLAVAPDAGVVSYSYEHHGTVSRVQLRLVRIQGRAE